MAVCHFILHIFCAIIHISDCFILRSHIVSRRALSSNLLARHNGPFRHAMSVTGGLSFCTTLASQRFGESHFVGLNNQSVVIITRLFDSLLRRAAIVDSCLSFLSSDVRSDFENWSLAFTYLYFQIFSFTADCFCVLVRCRPYLVDSNGLTLNFINRQNA